MSAANAYPEVLTPVRKPSFFTRLIRNIKKHPIAYVMSLMVLTYYIIFHYGAMWGLVIAFQRFSPRLGIFGSQWVGLDNFRAFINSRSFPGVVFNTLIINFYQLIFLFPAPIIFALLLNELRHLRFKKVVQTISYMPYFISTMVLSGMIIDFSMSRTGLFNDIIALLGGERTSLLTRPELFRGIYVGSSIWQELGYASIIFVASLTNIDQELYEAAAIDGASRWKQTLHITLPGITPVIIIMLILRMGRMMTLGFEKIILLYQPATYEVADVISSFVYRRGFLEADFGFGASVDMFNSVVNFSLMLIANYISRKFSETSLF